VDGASSDFDGSNLNDLTDLNDATGLDLLHDSAVDNSHNSAGKHEDAQNHDNIYNQSRFIRNRGEHPSMQVILEESRAENETTLDNHGEQRESTSSNEGRGPEENILRGLDSEQSISVNNETPEQRRLSNDGDPRMPIQNLQNLSSLSPNSSDVSKVIRFFDGPLPEHLERSRISLRGYNSNQYLQQQYTSKTSDMQLKDQTITSDVNDSSWIAPAIRRGSAPSQSEEEIAKNIFLNNIKKFSAEQNYNTVDASGTEKEVVDRLQMRYRSQTSRIPHTKKSAAMLKMNATKFPRQSTIHQSAGGAVLSKLNLE